MGNTITSLISGIETKSGMFLGSEYSKMSYGIDVALNRSKAASKRFAVLPEEATQQDSIGALVVDQGFRFKITDVYNPGKLNDHTIQDITNSLYDNIYGLYNYIVTEKCGVPSIVMNTFGLSVGKPEYIDDGCVTIEFTFTVKHRLTN